MDEVRVELVRKEHVPRGRGNEAETVVASTVLAGETRFEPGAPVELPFRLTVPPDVAPCFRTGQSTLGYELKGVGGRRLRSDYNVRQALNVYTATGTEARGAA